MQDGFAQRVFLFGLGLFIDYSAARWLKPMQGLCFILQAQALTGSKSFITKSYSSTGQAFNFFIDLFQISF